MKNKLISEQVISKLIQFPEKQLKDSERCNILINQDKNNYIWLMYYSTFNYTNRLSSQIRC